MKKILIGGTQSNSGKTTITASLLKALSSRGLKIAPFKAGPDYIDPMFHKYVSGSPSHNLDTFMLSPETVNFLFQKHSAGSDISIVEGVMGLFDGLGTEHRGSSAYLSEIIDAPVVLVANGKGMSRSVAALIQGYANFEKNTRVKGVILNNVVGDRHYGLLERAINENCDVKCLGYMPPNPEIEIKSRHLGLIPVEELPDFEKKLQTMAQMARDNIDLDAFVELAQTFEKEELPDPGKEVEGLGQGLRIAMAMDKAFNFYYDDNLLLFKQAGVELIEFSPMNDERLPENIDGLYLGGGFPEVFAKELMVNASMRRDIVEKLESGMPAFAECGGLMFLTKAIVQLDSSRYDMVGFLNCVSVMTKRLNRFGYVSVRYGDISISGHEFHHTRLEELSEKDMEYLYEVEKVSTHAKWQCGLGRKNVIAGYPHIHFYSNIDFFKKIIKNFRRNKDDNQKST